MEIQASTILQFICGRLYEKTPPTVLFGPLCEYISGQANVGTNQLPEMRKKYSNTILQKLPKDLAKAIQQWQHDDKWPEKFMLFKEAWGNVQI